LQPVLVTVMKDYPLQHHIGPFRSHGHHLGRRSCRRGRSWGCRRAQRVGGCHRHLGGTRGIGRQPRRCGLWRSCCRGRRLRRGARRLNGRKWRWRRWDSRCRRGFHPADDHIGSMGAHLVAEDESLVDHMGNTPHTWVGVGWRWRNEAFQPGQDRPQQPSALRGRRGRLACRFW
jgi:hypothetical protein